MAQVPYEEALDMAIFAINTFMHPEASTAEDIDRLENMAEDVIDTLDDMRTTLKEVGHA